MRGQSPGCNGYLTLVTPPQKKRTLGTRCRGEIYLLRVLAGTS